MPTNRADILVTRVGGLLNFAGAGTNYLVQTLAGVLYFVYIDTGNDLAFKKSVDGGLTWGGATVIYAGTVTGFAVWYDRWSGISGDLIHMAYTQTDNSDTLYRTINAASSDALSTQTTLFGGTSAVQAASSISITRARGGNVYVRTCIDAGAEGGFFRLPNANVPNGAWDAARTINEALATLDQIILVPGFAADNQDIMALFWDVSNNEISRQVYDDSGNSWGETSISTGMVEVNASASWPQFAAAVDLDNSRILLVAWNGADTSNADLLGWTVTESAITAFGTTPVLNGTDDQALAAISLDLQTGYWHVFYCGKSDGSETWPTTVNIYTKVSTDSGATWGPETVCTTAARNIPWLVTSPRHAVGVPPALYHYNITLSEIILNQVLPCRRASYQLGL